MVSANPLRVLIVDDDPDLRPPVGKKVMATAMPYMDGTDAASNSTLNHLYQLVLISAYHSPSLIADEGVQPPSKS